MVYGCTSWPLAGRLMIAALVIGVGAPRGAPPSEAPNGSPRTLAERRVRPVQPTGPRYATGASFNASPEQSAAAYVRLTALIGDWELDGTFSPRPDLPDRTLSGRFTIDWELRGMQLRLAVDQAIAGPATHLVPHETREVMYVAWSEHSLQYDAVHMRTSSTERRWLAGDWSDDGDTLTLYGARVGESRDARRATVRIEFTRESDDRWRYRTAARDPITHEWLPRVDAYLAREKIIPSADARERR